MPMLALISILKCWLDIDTELPFLSHLTARSYTHTRHLLGFFFIDFNRISLYGKIS